MSFSGCVSSCHHVCVCVFRARQCAMFGFRKARKATVVTQFVLEAASFSLSLSPLLRISITAPPLCSVNALI